MLARDGVAKTLDIGHEGCGTLLITLRRTIRDLAPGQILEVIGYDPLARDDIPAWCRLSGNPLLMMTAPAHPSEPTHFFIRKA